MFNVINSSKMKN